MLSIASGLCVHYATQAVKKARLAGGLAWSVSSRDHVSVDGWYASSTGCRSFRQLWNPPTAKICTEASQTVSQSQQ